MDYDSEPARGLRAAIELAEAGVLMHREFLRRENPRASEAELSCLLDAWLEARHRHEWNGPVFRERVRAPK